MWGLDTAYALVLVVDGEPVAFSIEEQPEKTLHQPTPDELRRQGDHSRWGYSGTPWAKYDRAPSQRLAIVINENSYSGLRRTYADGKTQTLDELLPTILAGFAEHAALAKERRRAAEQQRQWKEAEARRTREEAFNARKRRRMEFVESINEQLNQRQKLTTVLAHVEKTSGEHADRMDALVAWLRRRIQQIDAAISPLLLDLSARCEELDFAEVRGDPKWEDKGRYRSGLPDLKLWRVDEEKEEAISRSVLHWSIEAGLVPGFEVSQTVSDSPQSRT